MARLSKEKKRKAQTGNIKDEGEQIREYYNIIRDNIEYQNINNRILWTTLCQ